MKDTDIGQKILQFLNLHQGVTFSSRVIFKELNLPRSKYRSMRIILKDLANKRMIEKVGKRTYRIKKPPHVTIGTIAMTKYGYGFVANHTDKREIFIPRGMTGTAIDGDTVKVEVYASRRGKSLEGEVVEVLERAKNKIIGTYMEAKSFKYVIPDDKKFTRDLYIIKGKNKGAKPGEKVIAEFVKWESEYMNPEGIVKEVLGDPFKHGLDMTLIERAFELPRDFPAKVKREIKSSDFSTPDSEFKNRIELRNKLIFTIDPEDAKDFDDAVSLEMLENGNFLLSVHIADVYYYVRENTAIDKEAFKRGTSVYFPDRCIPMLPKKLSEDVCSLKPKKDRLSFTVFMEINPNGEVVDYKLAETVIKSKFRLTYENAQKLIDGKEDSALGKTLWMMSDLAKLLKKNRIKNGSLDFDLPEVKFSFDPLGIIKEIKPKPRLDSHILVEEFMLMANKVVTQFIEKKANELRTKIPFIYRIHEKPEKKKVEEYANFLKIIGIKFSELNRPTPKSFQRILKKVKDRPEERLVGEVTLRTMMKAEYSPKNIGHFGLAFKKYTHFTSPIRRYPDLVVHRILKSCLKGEEKDTAVRMKIKLNDICRHSSNMEKRAEEAEREAIKIKQLEYMKDKVGDVFNGIISSVKPYGLFVEIEGILSEGLVHIRSMDDDYYHYNEEKISLNGQYSGKTHRLGGKVKVQVARVNLEEKQLDLMIVY
ncbi:MAG: ribonuclease R [Candidatus Helarchaeota archaeon]|nr:ribonuclease R [Candidatus Helarchaeota archaeon]